MNKTNKGKINKNSYRLECRCDKYQHQMIKEIMEVQDCDKSTAIRLVLQYFMENGGVELIKE